MFSLSFTLAPAVVPDDPEKKPVEEAEDEQGKKKKTSVSELITPTPSILYWSSILIILFKIEDQYRLVERFQSR